MDNLKQFALFRMVKLALVALVRCGSVTFHPVAIRDLNRVAHQPSNGPQPNKKNDSESVNNAAVQGSALAPKLVVTVFNYLDHMRVARWDFFNDRGPAIVCLASTRDLASECRDRWLMVTLQQDSSDIQVRQENSRRFAITVLGHALLSDHRYGHERLIVNSVQDGKHVELAFVLFRPAVVVTKNM